VSWRQSTLAILHHPSRAAAVCLRVRVIWISGLLAFVKRHSGRWPIAAVQPRPLHRLDMPGPTSGVPSAQGPYAECDGWRKVAHAVAPSVARKFAPLAEKSAEIPEIRLRAPEIHQTEWTIAGNSGN
jgi:hypothetical protein